MSFNPIPHTLNRALIIFLVDFEQPRALWTKVFDDTAKEHFVNNVAGHISGAKSAEIKARQRKFAIPSNVSDLKLILYLSRSLRFCRC